VQAISFESGNSPTVIKRDYMELVSEEAAKKWFSIFPKPKPGETPGEPKPAAGSDKVEANAKENSA
jgi:hypothetical protein